VFFVHSSALLSAHAFKMDLLKVYYLSQAGYVIVVVCLSVCLSVSNFAQKLLNGFARNAQGRLAMGR